MKILDLGCGYGSKTGELLQKGEVYGIDISQEALAHAKANYPPAKFTLANSSKLPFPDEFFDEVHAYDVLEHVDDLQKTLSEASRALKAGGKFIAEVPNSDSEKMLSTLNPQYFAQIHHMRALPPSQWLHEFNSNGFFAEKAFSKGFFENVFLAASFSQGVKIVNQQGVIASSGKTVSLEILQKLAFFTEEEIEKQFGKKEVAELEVLTGFSVQDLSALLLACDSAFSSLFPKTIRFECVKKPREQAQAEVPFVFEKRSFRNLFENWNRLELMKAQAYGKMREVELGKQIALLEKSIAIKENEINEYKNGVANYERELHALQGSLKMKEEELGKVYELLEKSRTQLAETGGSTNEFKKELENAILSLREREKQLASRDKDIEAYKHELTNLANSIAVKETELNHVREFLKVRESQLSEKEKICKKDAAAYKHELNALAASIKIKEGELNKAYDFLKLREKQVELLGEELSKKDDEAKTLYKWLKEKEELANSLKERLEKK